MKLLHLATLLAFISAALLHHSTLLAAQDESIPPQVQSSVDRGLDWLAHTQDARTGSWPVNLDRPTPSVAVTSLAVMAFMARGHVPGQGPYGDNVNRGIDFILTQQQDNGLLSSANIRQAMYDHGIASIMLCEAYGMVDEPRQQRIKIVVAKAVRLILNAQTLPKTPRDIGGWRYTPTSEDSDISVTGWQLMALRGAANIGAPVPRKAIDLGIAYIKRRAVDGGGFSYILNGDPNAARTGTGILSLELLGQHHTKEALAGGDYLLRNALAGAHPHSPGQTFTGEHYYYTVYYCTQAANQLGGKYWDDIHTAIRTSLLQRQQQNGSWSAANTNEQQGGDSYATSMSILALTVPYRYLPIYQR